MKYKIIILEKFAKNIITKIESLLTNPRPEGVIKNNLCFNKI